MYTATLDCGTTLTFETRSFVPVVGDMVPCLRHGYCTVTLDGGGDGTSSGRGLARARPRTQGELLDFLTRERMTTVHALRRRRLTLRMVAAAERDGTVDVGLRAGTVAVRLLAPGDRTRAS
jgi:hypothetical protein